MSRDVLVVSAGPVPAPFGSPVYVGGMAEALASSGCRVRLLGPHRACGAALRRVTRPHPVRQVGAEAVVPGPSLRRLLDDVRLVIDVARAVRVQRPDVLLGHHGEGWLAAWLACRLVGARVPVVYVLHTSFEDELQAWLPGFAVRFAPWTRRAGAWLDRWLARAADACLAPSPAGCERLLAWGAAWVGLALPSVDVSIWPRPAQVHARARLGVPRDAPVALYAGNVDAYQDVPRWVDALALLPDVHGLFALASAPPAWLRERVSALGLEARVTFVVANDADALGWAHAAADVAVVPRAVCAGVPVKALNSLAYGLPTVGLASALPALAGLTRVESDRPEDLADAVTSALDGASRAAGEGSMPADGRGDISWFASLEEALRISGGGPNDRRDTR